MFGEAGQISLQELQLATRNHGMPLEILRYPRTPIGLHYLLIHFDVPHVDPADWRLQIGGRVSTPLQLSLDDVKGRAPMSETVTMECAGNGRALLEPRPLSQPWLQEAVGTAEWTGTSLADLLDEAGMAADAVEVVFTGLDRGIDGGVDQVYERSLSIDEVRRREVLLAYEMNGRPLPPQHGAPLRLVTPGWYGMTNVKWLSHITVVDQPFTGYQQDHSYRFRTAPDDPGEPMSRILPRALMAPPGIPDFYSRHRIVPTGRCRLEGRAWSGWGPITGVQVSVDGGSTWAEADVQPPELGEWAWQSWTYDWEPTEPAEHIVCCRARDAAGNDQAHFPPWNVSGYANPAPHRVTVSVRDDIAL
ncbi:MAG: sulfite oxidase [Actinomycetota bacterium]|nr:sulfite oxidase [Actinomycetota bacterium]